MDISKLDFNFIESPCRDVYCKRTLRFGSIYYDVNEKEAQNFVPTNGYRLVQKFNSETAIQICDEINRQFIKAYRWLDRFKKKNS